MLQVLRARLTQHHTAAAALASGGGAGPALETTTEAELFATVQRCRVLIPIFNSSVLLAVLCLTSLKVFSGNPMT
jgi:hypothetical protein